MRKRLINAVRPFICRECQARPAYASKPLPHVSTRRNHSTDNAEAVERRIASLGGREKVHTAFEDINDRFTERMLPAGLVPSYAKTHQLSRSAEDTSSVSTKVTVYGRVTSKRNLSRNLAFFSIATGGEQTGFAPSTQIVLTQSILATHTNVVVDAINDFYGKVQRGDWIAARGNIVPSKDGSWAVKATEMPRVLAPSLQPVPHTIADEEFRMRNRHADQIVHPQARDFLFLRHRLLMKFREFLTSHNFIEVNTPLLQANAGGAVARPFETVATEFSRLKLNLRVAPELYLKRLIIGGMQRVYELGSAFRNEGVDATHNPEFTTCEFYGVMLRLEDLIRLTEDLFYALAQVASQAHLDMPESIPPIDDGFFLGPYKTVPFVPAIREGIRQKLPNLKLPDFDADDALDQLIRTLESLNIKVPEKPTVPRLLDTLASEFIEPYCVKPTFVIHQPACMAPLAKSFYEKYTDGEVSQRVSARAELFIRGREYVNCYEEENSPIEQRRKFEEQLRHRHPAEEVETHSEIDESYLGALEWGMPPTGGWGCGFDRIVMLLAGQSRIADVLPFGTLRNVVGHAKTSTKSS